MAFGLSAGGAALLGAVAAPVIGGLIMGDHGAGDANAASANASNQQAAIAADQWNRYKEVYAPLEDKMVAEAQTYASPENYARAAGDASATVSSQFSKARDRLGRTAGLDPSSGAYTAGVVGLNLAQAATDATAQNAARKSVTDTSYARKTDALSLGKGLAATASSSLATASSGSLAQAKFGQDVANQQAGQVGRIVDRVTSGWLNSGTGAGGGAPSGQFVADRTSAINNGYDGFDA